MVGSNVLPMGDERRKPPNRRLAALFVGSDDGTLPFGRTRDLSLTGIFLETGGRPAIGQRYEIGIAWGEGVFGCQAKIVRHAVNGVALTFIDPDTFFLQAIQEIMETSPPVDIVPGTKRSRAYADRRTLV